MINCEQFEENFIAWKNESLEASQSNAMKQHFSTCQYCVDISVETIEIREAVVGVYGAGPSEEFKYNLKSRISDLLYRNKEITATHKAKLPHWAALGAGIATGLAIGIVLLMPSKQENSSQYVANNQLEKDTEMVVDTTTLPADSLDAVNETYQLDNRSRMVSGK